MKNRSPIHKSEIGDQACKHITPVQQCQYSKLAQGGGEFLPSWLPATQIGRAKLALACDIRGSRPHRWLLAKAHCVGVQMALFCG